CCRRTESAAVWVPRRRHRSRARTTARTARRATSIARASSELQVLRGTEVIDQRRQALEVLDDEREQLRRTCERFVEADAGGVALALQVFQQRMVGRKTLWRAAQRFAPEFVVLAECAAVHGALP